MPAVFQSVPDLAIVGGLDALCSAWELAAPLVLSGSEVTATAPAAGVGGPCEVEAPLSREAAGCCSAGNESASGSEASSCTKVSTAGSVGPLLSRPGMYCLLLGWCKKESAADGAASGPPLLPLSKADAAAASPPVALRRSQPLPGRSRKKAKAASATANRSQHAADTHWFSSTSCVTSPVAGGQTHASKQTRPRAL